MYVTQVQTHFEIPNPERMALNGLKRKIQGHEVKSTLVFKSVSLFLTDFVKVKEKYHTQFRLLCQTVRPISQPFDNFVLAEQRRLVKIQIAFCIHVQHSEASLIHSPAVGDQKQTILLKIFGPGFSNTNHCFDYCQAFFTTAKK